MTYLHPLKIGNVTLPHNIVFGPMAGVSDLPFRLLCHEQGSALGVTELISAKAITYRNRNTAAMLQTHPDEGAVAIQLFGHEPEVFAEAVRVMEEMELPVASTGSATEAATYSATEAVVATDEVEVAATEAATATESTATSGRGIRYDILDINMGCPVPKVVGNGEGSALMKEPGLIEEIVRACVRAEADACGAGGPKRTVPFGPRPVSVKMRAGFDPKHVNAVECALAAEAGGAAAVTVHARTRDQMYSGKADWSVIRAVKEAVKIPVIGNGDVADGESAKRMIEETGCDGVMIARAAQGNPWVFREVRHYLQTGERMDAPTAQEKFDMVMRHLDLLVQYKGEYVAVREMRGHLAHYTRGMGGAARMRERINQVEGMMELKEICAVFFRG